jgi:hypothetical protein
MVSARFRSLAFVAAFLPAFLFAGPAAATHCAREYGPFLQQYQATSHSFNDAMARGDLVAACNATRVSDLIARRANAFHRRRPACFHGPPTPISILATLPATRELCALAAQRRASRQRY